MGILMKIFGLSWFGNNILVRCYREFWDRTAVLLQLCYPYLINAPDNTNAGADVWLIGENRGECLKENGYWFFQYCRKNHPNRKVFFVIKKKSPYYQNEMFKDDSVIVYGSKRHGRVFKRARLCFYTHTYRDLVYRRLFEIFGRGKKLVYLHHGVLGFKKFNSFYQKHRNIMDLFVVGSNLEKSILINQVGVDSHRIEVLGYPRNDGLYDASHENTGQIVYIPTHRNYLRSAEDVEIFIEELKQVTENDDLINILLATKTIMKIYLHKEIQMFSIKLESSCANIKVIYHGEESPQNLIRESSLLITDYSSVSWDFFYLGKKVVFYRFDIERFLADRGSYMNLEEGTIGRVCFTVPQLVKEISESIAVHFVNDSEFQTLRQEILPNIDTSNCSRVYEHVTNLN